MFLNLEAPTIFVMIRKVTRNASWRSRRNEHEAGSIRRQHLWTSTSHSETWRKGWSTHCRCFTIFAEALRKLLPGSLPVHGAPPPRSRMYTGASVIAAQPVIACLSPRDWRIKVYMPTVITLLRPLSPSHPTAYAQYGILHSPHVHAPHVHVYSGPLVSSVSGQVSCFRRDHQTRY